MIDCLSHIGGRFEEYVFHFIINRKDYENEVFAAILLVWSDPTETLKEKSETENLDIFQRI